jgi:hypothetical protein
VQKLERLFKLVVLEAYQIWAVVSIFDLEKVLFYEIKTSADMRSANNQIFCLADRGYAYQLQIVGTT